VADQDIEQGQTFGMRSRQVGFEFEDAGAFFKGFAQVVIQAVH
jgi:hypothetical protein